MSIFFGLFLTFFLFIFEVVSNKHHRPINVKSVHDKSLNSFIFIFSIHEGNFRLNLVELPFVRLGFFIFLILFIHLIKIFFCSNLFFEVGYRSVVHLAFFQSIGENYTGIELFYHSQSESEQIV